MKSVHYLSILLLFSCLIPCIAAQTWIVDDDSGPDVDYSCIQDAINNSISGDTIIVRSGTYFERVIVNKTLNLIGEDTGSGNPVINAKNGGEAITIQADDTLLDGFTTSHAHHGVFLNSSENCVLNDIKILLDYYIYHEMYARGIRMLDSNFNTFSEINIIKCVIWCESGMQIYSSNYNTFENIKITMSTYDHIYLVSSNNNSFKNLELIGPGTALRLSSSNYNYFKNVVATRSNYPYVSSSSNYNVLADSRIGSSGNTIQAILLYSRNENNLISNVTITSFYPIDSGIGIRSPYYAYDNTITKCTIRARTPITGYYHIVFFNNFLEFYVNPYWSKNTYNSTQPITYSYNGQIFTNYLGNYWGEKYTGVDADGDGIGDTPFYTDYHPLIEKIENYTLITNQPPVASAGGPYIGEEGTSVIFDGSSSTDLDNDSLQYRWDFNGDGNWDTEWTYDPIATYLWNNEYTGEIRVEVTDGEYYSNGTASITICNVPPTATVESNSPVDEGSSITITVSATDPGTEDILTYSFDWDNDGVFDIEEPESMAEHVYDDNGTYTIGVKVTDDDGANVTKSIDVVILDKAPIADFTWEPDPVDEGTTVAFYDQTQSFPDEIVAWQWSGAAEGTEKDTSCYFADNGTFTIILSVEDDDGSVASAERTIDVANVAPAFEAGPDVTIDEGESVTRDILFMEPGDDTVSAEIDYGEENPGIQKFDALVNSIGLTHSYMDEGDGMYTVSVTLSDEDGGVTTDSFTVNVNNVAPNITSITPPETPIEVYMPVGIAATFTDPGADQHIATWDWGDGSITDAMGLVDEESREVSGSHIYQTPGVYTVTLTIDDGDEGTDTQICSDYIVIYDPEGGFVTGGGWIWSPAGAYRIDTSLEGKATFGFISKYKNGATVPTGNTEFQFKAGDLNFHSDVYDWLVIAGGKAMYKGIGTINGEGAYKFMISAIDGDPDTFRIKIWEEVNDQESIIYDNQNLVGGEDIADDADPITIIGGGSIVVHKEK